MNASPTNSANRLLAAFAAMCLVCAAQAADPLPEGPPSNWTTADAPCAKYDDLRNPVLGNIGVRIDVAEPWAEGFRRALEFWNTVLVANFREENRLSECAIRVIYGDGNVLTGVIVARSQMTNWLDFRGKIAVRSSVDRLSPTEIYATAVHEIGHLLGLKHNASSQSVMYFLDVTGNEVLDLQDIVALSQRHKLRPAACSGALSIPVFPSETPALAIAASDSGLQN